MKRIFLFDFDGTITKKDSFLLFTYHSVNILTFFCYWFKTILLICFSSVPKSKLKESFFLNFENISAKKFQLICDNFVNKYFDKIIKENFFEYVNKLGPEDTIVIVSASIRNYLYPWCKDNGFNLICTELEEIDQRLTGAFKTPNCNFNEKVNRILKEYEMNEFDEIYAFGDSPGDYEMMKLANKKYFKYFK